MDDQNRKINVFSELSKHSGILAIVTAAALWFFSTKSFNSYFNSFFIDTSQIVSYSIVWAFASQKLLTLINTSLFIGLATYFFSVVLKDLRKEYIPPSQTPQPNIKLKPKARIPIIVFTLAFTLCIAYFFIVSLMLFNGGIGTLRAKIDQERFNNSNIIPQKITVDNVTNEIKCVAILGSFDQYTFVIYQNREAELIKSSRILSIKPMFHPASTLENTASLKEVNKQVCGKQENTFLITTKPDSFYFKIVWPLSNLILRPKDPL